MKAALLLQPATLGHSWDFVKILFIDKSAAKVGLTTKDLTDKFIRVNYGKMPPDARYVLRHFANEAVDEKISKTDSAYNKTKQDISFETYCADVSVRYFYDILFSLKPYLALIPFYTKILKGKDVYDTMPATFSLSKPVLSFVVKKYNSRLRIETLIQLKDLIYQYADFKRYHFLLQSNNTWFILSYKDYQVLERLNAANSAAQAGQSIKDILILLEQDYKVNRNNLFEKKTIAALPVERIFLSELNNAFLMLTPQWVYDGIIIEGPFRPYFDTVIAGDEVIIERNEEAEKKLIATITSLHAGFAAQRNGYYYVSFAEAQKKQWFLKAYHLLLDQGIQLTGIDMLSHFRYSPYKIETKHTVESETGNKLQVNMQVSFGAEKVNMVELQKMVLAGQKAILLKDNSLGILNEEWMQQYGTIIRHGKVAKESVEVSRFMAVSLGRDMKERGFLNAAIKEQWWAKWQQWQSSEEAVYDVPAIVAATLRPYQHKGYEWLALLSEIGAGGCLADDMGLGKTLQTICFIARFQQENPGLLNIIIAPSSLLYNWKNEFQKFAPGITTLVYHGAGRNTGNVLSGSCHVIITSYGTLRADAAMLLPAQYGVAVLDESHNVKNPAAKITGIVQQLNAVTRIGLSGTPVINNTFDLYSQLSFALPGMFGSREFFKREYADAIDRDHNEEKIKGLQKLTAPFILRRTKEQVATDLPAKTESILWCSMSREQQDLYNEIKEQVKSNVFTDINANGLAKSKLGVIQGLMKLRQVCNSPLLLPADERQATTKSVKTEVLMSELANILKDHKVLVFSQFTTMLDLLMKECDKKDIKYFCLTGQTPIPKRAEMAGEFQQADCDTHLFLISLKAGGTGLTLTAADYIFLFDPYWNRAIEQQAIDRAHRIGQDKSVFAYKIICKNTVEERIIQLQNRKQKIADELIGEDDGFIKSLTEEDLQFLFS